MNYHITEVTEDSFTIWDGKTFHPDFARQPMGEMIFINQPNHGFAKGDVVQLTVRLVNRDQAEIENRLAEGAGARASDQVKLFKEN